MDARKLFNDLFLGKSLNISDKYDIEKRYEEITGSKIITKNGCSSCYSDALLVIIAYENKLNKLIQ